MSAFIDEHRAVFGVEPICRSLGIAPSTYYAVCERRRRRALWTVRDDVVVGEIRRVYATSRGLFAARKVW
jgi:putative transposase